MKKLSDLSDVSVAAIRKIEMGVSNPSLLTVLALVEALDEPVDRLITEAVRSREQTQLVRADTVQAANGTIPLSDGVDNRKMSGVQCTLGAGEKLSIPSGERPLFGYVIEGEITLERPDGREHRCSRGDAFHAIKLTDGVIRGSGPGARLLVVEKVGGEEMVATFDT